MSSTLKKLWSDYGIGAIVVLLIVAYGVSVFAKYLTSKGMYGSERMESSSASYKASGTGAPKGSSGPQPSEGLDRNEVFASVNGIATPNIGVPTSCSKPNIQNPSDLLPKDSNSQWAQLNPSGKGDLANINLLKAGYHIGIDTIGQTLRNANLQIRSEPPNPQLYVGPWNLSTIEPDFMRPPLELGAGTQ
uniref:Minor capsid protein P11 C-terminal conserved region domain-containing protein n=1 Tax=viral metagenome TaxID=1070528 RepID=A0A6C0JZC2_9ZZZZ